MSTNEVSKSMQKRIDRKKKQQAAKREGIIGAVIGILAIAIIIGGIAYSIISAAFKQSMVVVASDNFGENIDDNGYVKDVTAKDIVTLPADYASITVPYSEIEYTDEDFENDKKSALESYRAINTETDKKIESGDEINLDYVGSIDGKEFEGGSSNGQGYNLTIGSNTFIPGFEDQLIGHQIGDVFDINVTFPEDYSNDPEVAGKDAVFNITINGIYIAPEFDDEFVKENLSEYGSTVEEYKAYLKNESESDAKRTYVINYLATNSSLSKYPKAYLKQLKSNQKYQDQTMYNYMGQIYAMYNSAGPSSFEEYVGMTEEEYDISLEDTCKQQELENLARQAICELQGYTVTDDEIKEYIVAQAGEDAYQSTFDTYGRGYFAQLVLQKKAEEFIVNNAVVK